MKTYFKLDGKNAHVWKGVLMAARVITGIVISQLPLKQLPQRTQLQARLVNKTERNQIQRHIQFFIKLRFWKYTFFDYIQFLKNIQFLEVSTFWEYPHFEISICEKKTLFGNINQTE